MTYGSTLQALADPTRRAIFEAILYRPRAVGELADQVAVSQPAVSQHLKVLREAGLVEARPSGTRRIHHPRREGLRELRDYIDGLWGSALEAYRTSFDEEGQP